MDFSIGSSYMTGTLSADTTKQAAETEELKNKLNNSSSDEEILEACKSFEQYFVEQVIQEMRNTVMKNEEDSEYMEYFGDMLYQKYAESITESGQLGIAQQLYEAMKRDSGL